MLALFKSCILVTLNDFVDINSYVEWLFLYKFWFNFGSFL